MTFTSSYDYLKAIIEEMDKVKIDGEEDIFKTVTCVELLLAMLTPIYRKRTWDYLKTVRAEMKDTIFEDESDYLDFMETKGIPL